MMKQWHRSQKALIVLPGLFCLLTVGGYFAYQRANYLPPAHFPNATMPSPNARDFYMKAGNTVVQEKEIGEAVTVKTASKYTLAEKRKFVAANAAALQTFREGMQYPYLQPPARSFATLFPEYAKYRNLARLLVLEGQTKAAGNDWGGATNSYLDTLYLGHEVPRGGVLIGELVGLACEAIGRRPAWDAAKKVNAPDARDAAKRLEEMEAKRFPLADTLQEEKWCMQASLRQIFGSPVPSQNIAPLIGVSPKDTSTPQQMAQGLFWNYQILRYGKRQILENNARYMDGLSAKARQPYAAHTHLPPQPTDALNRIIAPVFGGVFIKEADSRNQNALLMTVFALRAYQTEKGAYPVSLGELVQAGILKRLPDDPFALAGTFGYRRLSADNYLLYSVGPDSKDDNGNPIENRAKDGTQKRYAEEGTKGDFVVGVNTY